MLQKKFFFSVLFSLHAVTNVYLICSTLILKKRFNKECRECLSLRL